MNSRVLDTVVIGEETTAGTEAGSYNIALFGDIVQCSLNVEEDKRVINGLTGSHLPSKIVGLKVTPSGSITFHPHNFQFMKYVISDYVEGSGTYTLANDTIVLPKSLSVKGTYDGSKGIRHLGAFLTNVKFGINDEDILTVTADILSLFCDVFTGSLTYTPSSNSPLTFSSVVMTFGGNEWDLQSLNLTYDSKLIQKYGLNNKSSGKIRFPSAIIRGSKAVISFDGTVNVQDITQELQTAWGGTSPQDYGVSNSTITLVFTDEVADTHTITVSGQITRTEVLQSDSEENSKTMTFSGVGTDFSISGERP